MPNEPPSGVTETCPDCMARGQQPSAWHRPDAQTLTCAYTCTNCRREWECSWWQGVA
nr:MAG TPA_asm: zinc-ribbon domain protein [Caudoviricetes sp.]